MGSGGKTGPAIPTNVTKSVSEHDKICPLTLFVTRGKVAMMDFTSTGPLLASPVIEPPKKPLERARERLNRLVWGKQPPKEPKKDLPLGVRQQQIVQMRAQAGFTVKDIARRLGVSTATVDRDLAKPHVARSVKELREAFKRAILEQSTRDIVEPAFEMARNKISAGEAKDFDATMRGINALEKTTMSASGEAQKVDVTSVQVTLNRQELYARIEGLLGDPE